VPDGNGAYRLRSHDSLKISGGLWHWFSKGIGGRSALDYLIKVEGIPFTEAATIITEFDNNYCTDKNPNSEKKRPAFLLPPKHTDNKLLFRYLEDVRKIDRSVISDFIRRGLLYESHFTTTKNQTFRNAVFVGLNKDGVPKYATIRGLFTRYKGDAEGSDKRYSLSLTNGSAVSKNIHVFESAIDLMSYLTLANKKGRQTQSGHFISLSGIYIPKQDTEEQRLPLAIERYLGDHSEISKAVLHLDNDEAGQLSARSLTLALTQSGLDVVNSPSPYGNDYNDYLRHRVGKTMECRDGRNAR
jgi:hypothetical protein